MESNKEYYAFISYKREDGKWAKWLQDKLEHYRFPTNLNGRTDLPKHIRPTFRDVTDLKPGLLAEEINNALCNSEWLIVVCSPRSAKSPWVCKEAQTFIDLGRADHIIPFVIEGYPFSNDTATECYPEALLNLTGSKELLAANINEMGRDAAAIKVVARMFNLKFDTLWQRYEREKKRMRWMIIGGSLLFAFVATVIASLFFILNSELKSTIMDRDSALHLADSVLIQIRKDSVVLAEHLDRIMRDSFTLAKQNDSIRQQKDEITKERVNVERANYGKGVNLSRLWAKEASELLDNGDSYSARLILLQALTQLPYTYEADSVLRIANQYNNAIIKGHDGWVEHASFSSDGKLIVSASTDGSIRIWDVATGKQIGNPMTGHDAWVNYASFSPDGTFIVSASNDCTIRIWDVETGKQIGDPLTGHTNQVRAASFSPDGKYIVSASDDKTIRIWDVETGKQIGKPLEGHTSYVRFVAFSPDGKKIASASWDKTIRIWNAYTGKQIGKPLEGHTNRVMSVAFSPDGKKIASASWDHTIRIWDVATGELIGKPMSGHHGWVNYASFSPDGKYIVSASDDKTIRIWDVEELLKESLGDVRSVFFSPDGNSIVSASWGEDGGIGIWDICRGKLIKKHLEKSKDDTFYASYSIDGKCIVSANNSGIKIWDAVTGKLIPRFSPVKYGTTILSVSYSPDNKHIVSASNDSTIRIWDVATGKQIGNPLTGHKDEVNTAFFSPDGKHIVSASDDKTIRIWDVATGKQIGNPLEGHLSYVKSASFSPDGNYIVSASWDNTIRIWDTATRKQVGFPLKHNESVNFASFSPNGKFIVTGTYYGTISLWDFPPSLQQLIKETRERLNDRQLSPEERRKYYLE